jgi:hypothetical protein
MSKKHVHAGASIAGLAILVPCAIASLLLAPHDGPIWLGTMEPTWFVGLAVGAGTLALLRTPRAEKALRRHRDRLSLAGLAAGLVLARLATSLGTWAGALLMGWLFVWLLVMSMLLLQPLLDQTGDERRAERPNHEDPDLWKRG